MVVAVAELPNVPDYTESVLRPLLEKYWVRRNGEGESSPLSTSMVAAAATAVGVVGAVVHDEKPLSAEKYALQRAGRGNQGVDIAAFTNNDSEVMGDEASAWRAHLAKENISSVANSVIFLQLRAIAAATADTAPAASTSSQPRPRVENEDAESSQGSTWLKTTTSRQTRSSVDLGSHEVVQHAARSVLEP